MRLFCNTPATYFRTLRHTSLLTTYTQHVSRSQSTQDVHCFADHTERSQSICLTQPDGELHLTLSSPSTSPPHPNIIVHLPCDSSAGQASTITSQLAARSHSTVVTIHYRAGSLAARSWRWPTPLHDTLAAWDWLSSFPSALQHLPPERTYTICGRSFGGTLALALGMTESLVASPHAISNIRTVDAVVDWPALSLPDGRSDAELQKLRTRIFGLQGERKWYDPFASPIHFLRTPVIEEKRPAAVDLLAGLREKDSLWEEGDEAVRLLEQLDLSSDAGSGASSAESSRPALRESASNAVSTSSVAEEKRSRARTYLRRWPPSVPVIAMPRFQMSVTKGREVLRAQNEEFITELRRALVRERTRGMKSEEDGEGAGVKGRTQDNEVVRAIQQEVERDVVGVLETDNEDKVT